MLYQFMDWRIGLHRVMCLVDVERLLKRLREANVGKLPFCLQTWEQVQIFAGEAAITLPEMQSVAEAQFANERFPTVQWLRERYEDFLKFMDRTEPMRAMMVDPPAAPPPTIPPLGTIVESTVTPPTDFDKIVEGSVSNTQAQQCSEPNPATLSPGSTSTGSPSTLLTDSRKPRQQPQRR